MIINNLTKTILDSLHEGILIINKDGIVLYVNPAYTKGMGVSYDEIVGELLSDVRPGAMLPNVVKTGKKLLRVKRKTKDVEYIVNMTPIKIDGEIAGGISVVLEMTDAYKLAEELKQYNKVINNLQMEIRNAHKAKYFFDDIVAEDIISIRTVNYAKKISKNDLPVHICGETGCGKELYAHSIHNESNRKHGPFVAISCANLDRQLLESELFGYEEGSFTGALKGGKRGLFEVANGGTIFLDEIAEMDYYLQAKLLRVIQEGTIRRIGGTEEIPVDVRVVSATNKSLESMVKEKKFRADLYFRINVFPLFISPLRERRNDIEDLVRVFMEDIQRKFKRNVEITREALDVLFSYDWPGNVRELKNAVEFAANMTEDFIIDVCHLPKHIQTKARKDISKIINLEDYVKEAEILAIKRALNRFGRTVEGKKKSSEALGISLATLYNKLKKYDIEDTSD